MPFVIYVLGLAVFAQGTSEFMLSGLVPDIATDMHVSIPTAGLLTSAFAIGMVVGAPLVAMLSLRWPRRTALLTFLAAFVLAHVVGAITGSFAVLLATRVVAAVSYAGFLAIGLATATAMVAPHVKGRVASVMLSGVTLACIAGVPAGAALGQLWGWRAVFWAVAIVSLPALAAIVMSVPGGARPAGPGIRDELRALLDGRLAVLLVLGALVNGATFSGYTYLAPLITDVSGLGPGWVPIALGLFGVGSFVGVTLGGRLADSRAMTTVALGAVALVAGWLVLALTAGSPAAALVLMIVLGTLAFGVGSTLIGQILYAGSAAPTLAGAAATASFNVGATLGPTAGGLAIAAGFGYRSPAVVGAGLMATALLAGITAHLVSRAARDAGSPLRGNG
ncbi:Cmx/CmrA family chloramphenicol efflux MFS transporter [Pseudonocardia sp. TRM90224]|uniref:Cmx/CmrA family chloramphenicol efflux MFS transporter n=1 Tax=Pseudonocardia sp. TRM90224 TaxID=2812678 RepID=UPI001E44E241|nr:Cmx/CmrA family chloramphenicol efflux MFS transporter [Pseudonocardia sp. TRM90224]